MIVKLNLDLAKRSEIFRNELAEICEEPDLLSDLSRDRSILVLQTVAKNLLTKKEDLIRLAQYPDSLVQRAVAQNGRKYPEVINLLVYSKYSVVKIQIAQDTADCNILDILSNDFDYLVRQAVAINPKTRLKTLISLADDEEVAVKIMMANCKKIKREVRVKLMNDSDYRVRNAIATRDDCTSEFLHEMAIKESNITVIKNIARNHKTKGETLDVLVQKSPDAWIAVAENPNTFRTTLDVLATSQNIDVLIAVLDHKNTSEAAIVTLKRHKNCFIRNRAFNRYLHQ